MLTPGVNAGRRSTGSAVRHACAVRADEASGVPLSQTSAVSSPVTTNRAAETAPSGTVNVVRKYRVPAGAATRGLPSGNQIQCAPASSTGGAAPAGGTAAADRTRTAASVVVAARQSFEGSMRAPWQTGMDHRI